MERHDERSQQRMLWAFLLGGEPFQKVGIMRTWVGFIVWIVVFWVTAASGHHELPPFVEQPETAVISPAIRMDVLDPMVRKWYVSQHMIPEYKWRSWETTAYARDPYRAYYEVSRTGEVFYDLFGHFVTQGSIWYTWRHEQPHLFGSSIKRGQITIASDSMGRGFYALMIGEGIRTTLTPLTFSKPSFNGIQWDFVYGEVWKGTVLVSRVNDPGFSTMDYANTTTLWAGRITVEPVRGVRLGLTYVNAHNGRTTESPSWRHFRRGHLGAGQLNGFVDLLAVRISDDSPGDGQGPLLYGSELVIVDRTGNRIRAGDLGLHPTVKGGKMRDGHLIASGGDPITLVYDLSDSVYTGPHLSQTDHLSVELRMSGDYRVEVTSNRQINADRQPVFLPVVRAEGNVRDETNRRVVCFDYGLPTGREVVGATLEVEDWHGFGGLGEVDVSRGYRQHPNMDMAEPFWTYSPSTAGYANLFYHRYPLLIALEGFHTDDGYSTSCFGVDRGGDTDYSNLYEYGYEFVDDNDDFDEFPDWRRYPRKEPDPAVFPGLDENNDGVSDFNQNDHESRPNYLPDYEEPFLRYGVDPPEFIVGMDMNHNGWVDRFENDNQPDYPYKRDHRGMNLYVQHHLTPQLRWSVGRLDEHLIAGDGHNRSTYGLVIWDHQPVWGRLRMFQQVERVRDTIRDDLIQWVQIRGERGALQSVEDPLHARDTYGYTNYVDGYYQRVRGLNVAGKLKVQGWVQRDRPWEARRSAYFLGGILKADYVIQWRRVRLWPKWKSTFREERPYLRSDPVRRELEETLFCTIQFPLLRNTEAEAGWEWTRFFQLRPGVSPSLPGDGTGRVLAGQLTHKWDYQGSRLTTQIGYRFDRWHTRGQPAHTNSTMFISSFAGMEMNKLRGRR